MADRQSHTGPIFVASSSGSNLTELVRDFLVDGLGILLPGLGFLFACIPAVILPLIWFIYVIEKRFSVPSNAHSPVIGIVTSVEQPLSNFHVEIALALIGLSYVVGHLLFRQDIKEPDKKSFLRAHMPQLSLFNEVRRWIVRVFGSDARFPIRHSDQADSAPSRPSSRWNLWQALRPEVPIRIIKENGEASLSIAGGKRLDGMVRPVETDTDLSEVSVDYPYHFLFEYLTDREFEHLAGVIPWHGSDGKYLASRSKHFINLLKANLHQYNPTFSHLISKNEAHIRLASSVWYAAHYITQFSLIGICLSLAGTLLRPTGLLFTGSTFSFISVTMLIIAILIQSLIERSLHYQRCREIFFVLHSAALTRLQKPNVFFGINEMPAPSLPNVSAKFAFKR